jgi:hypothetical protein
LIKKKFHQKNFQLINISFKYFIKRSAFIYFFSETFNIHMISFNKLFLHGEKSESILNYSSKIFLGGFFNFIYEDFYLNKNVILFMLYKLYSHNNMFFHYQRFLNRFVNYNY